jgi:hypothetical protein
MADKYFAILDDNNIVTDVILLDVADEAEGIAQARTVKDNQSLTVVETFPDASNTATRYNYAGIGSIWDSENQAFHRPQTYASWTLDSNYIWQPPVARPTSYILEDNTYLIMQWNESEQRWDGYNPATQAVDYHWNSTTLAWDAI